MPLQAIGGFSKSGWTRKPNCLYQSIDLKKVAPDVHEHVVNNELDNYHDLVCRDLSSSSGSKSSFKECKYPSRFRCSFTTPRVEPVERVMSFMSAGLVKE